MAKMKAGASMKEQRPEQQAVELAREAGVLLGRKVRLIPYERMG